MTLEITIAITSSLIGMAGFALALLLLKKQRGLVERLELVSRQNEDLEQSVAEAGRADRQKLTEQARRIAWLESRVRQPKTPKKETAAAPDVFVQEKIISGPLRSNITERRHRVMTLALRGQNAESIASTLGMMTGEVELILNLNRGSVSAV